MRKLPHNLAMVAPVSLWPNLEAMLAELGWILGEGVELSANGDAPATHRAVHARASDSNVAVATGQTVPDIDEFTAEQITNAVGQLQTHVVAFPNDALAPLLNQAGLKRVLYGLSEAS